MADGLQSVEWPDSDAALLVLLAVWFLVTRAFIAMLGGGLLGARRPAHLQPGDARVKVFIEFGCSGVTSRSAMAGRSRRRSSSRSHCPPCF